MSRDEGHELGGSYGHYRCTCGWQPALGVAVWRAFDRHLAATTDRNARAGIENGESV